MKIVVFDVELLGSGKDDWDRLKQLDSVESLEKYIDVTDDELIEKAQGADMTICNSGSFYNGALSKLPELKYLGLMTTGYNQVDMEEARKRIVDIAIDNAINYVKGNPINVK